MYNGDFSNWRDANGNLIPIYDPATTRVNPNGPGFVRDPFPGQPDSARALQPDLAQRPAAGDDAARPAGCAQQFHLHAGRPHQDEPVEQVQHQARSQPVEQGSARIPVPLGRGARDSAGGGPGGGLPVPLNNFRDEDSHTHVYRANWDRVITPTLLNRVTFGHNNWCQLRASFNRDQGWGTKIGLQERAGPGPAVPADRFLERLSRLGPIGVGRLGQLSVGAHRRPDLGQGEPHVEVRVHRPAGSLRRLRLAHGRGHLQLQPRRDRRLPAQRHARRDRRDGQRVRDASCSAKCSRPRSRPIATCPTGGATTPATRRTTGASATSSRSTTACATSTRRRPGRATTPTGTRTSTRTCRIRPPAAGSARRSSPARVRAAPGRRRCTRRGRGGSARGSASSTAVNNDTVVRVSAARTFGSVKNTGGSSHWNGFIGGYNVTAPALPGQLRVQLGSGLAGLAGAAVPRSRNAQRQQHPVLAAVRLRAPAGVLLVDAQPAAAVARPLRRGGGLQRAARAASDDEPAQPESGRSRDLLRLRPAVRAGGRDQPDELAHGFDAGAPGRTSRIPIRPSQARSRCGRRCVRIRSTSTSITGADGGDRSGRSSYHAFVLKGEKRYASGLTFLTSYVFSKTFSLRSDRANAGDGRAMNHFNRDAEKGLSAFDQTHVDQVELQLRAAVRSRTSRF